MLAGAVVLPVVVGAAFALQFASFIADETFLMFRYADRFASGQGLTYTDGERVEAVAGLLWPAWLGVLRAVGVDVVWGARLLALGAGALVIAALVRASSWGPPQGARVVGASMFGGLVVATSAPWAVWSVGGVEVVGFGALLAFGLVELRPLLTPNLLTAVSGWRVAAGSLPWALLPWARFESVALVVVVVIGLVVGHSRSRAARRRVVLFALPVMASVGVQVVLRAVYYGDWAPNVLHRLDVSTESAVAGLDYLAGSLPVLGPALVAASLGVLAGLMGHGRREVIVAGAVVLAWTTYVVVIGGDAAPAFRLLVPLLPTFGLLAVGGARWLSTSFRLPRRAGIAAMVATAALGVGFGLRQPDLLRADAEGWSEEGEALGNVLGRGLAGASPLVAVGDPGTLPFFSRLPALDMSGRADRHLARVPLVRSATRKGRGGLRGARKGAERVDAGYVLDRAPDLLVFQGVEGGAPLHLLGAAFQKDPRFAREYSAARFAAGRRDRKVMVAYARLSGRAGLRRDGEDLEVPSWLFGPDGAAELGVDGILRSRFPARKLQRSPPLELEAGSYVVTLDPPDPAAELRAQAGRGGKAHLRRQGNRGVWTLEVSTRGAVRLLVTAGGADLFVASVRLSLTASRGPGRAGRPR